MKNIINLSLLVCITALGLYADGAHAWVQKISLERVFVGENIRIHEVAVRCRVQKKPRIMRKQASNNGPWCSTDIPSLCAKSKISAARQLCKLNADEFTALANAEAENLTTPVISDNSKDEQKADSKNDLLAEQMLIEEQRIEIAQRKIELTRREVALKKRLSEMADAPGV